MHVKEATFVVYSIHTVLASVDAEIKIDAFAKAAIRLKLSHYGSEVTTVTMTVWLTR